MSENLELREWLAVNVMGLPNVVNHGEWLTYQPEDEPLTRHVPFYELTWNDAALVAEAMRGLGWNAFTVGLSRTSPFDKDFAAMFGKFQNEPVAYTETAPTGPLAICLAAKAAIEGAR